MLSLLYVSKNEKEWKLDLEDLEQSKAIAYVVNIDAGDLSEFGTIGISPKNGGVTRTW
jgi:hypothetical protein